ncbi:hypothetical protein [Enterococcus termitis]|uniref:Uncharacterized protein n=1 Tax=Enterococcus termitis TaxID=332950 RepID=A0A1E5H0U0_9ENTE|nr:hypothetical protein [Enterococcus termitis]OEG18432.1 hypothetical protein BCR25_16545 [Enterococcus termitis]
MNEQEVEQRKEAQRQKIREIGQNARIKSLENQLKTERDANQHLEKIGKALESIQQVVDTWDSSYENTPEKRRSELHIVNSTTEGANKRV